MSEEKRRATYVGMPWQPKLHMFGQIVYDAFDSHGYLVGSCLQRRDWRDVDVRVILDDDDPRNAIGLGWPARSRPASEWRPT